MRRWKTGRILVALALANFAIAALSSQSEAANRDVRSHAARASKRAKTTEAKRHIRSAEKVKLPVNLKQALYLIRSTLMTLDDANRTGNYSVLRDLAAPGVQARYTPADLGQIFSSLRENHVVLSAVALEAPKLSSPPKLERNGQLRLTGHFPTKPRQINFDLLFQVVAGHWKWLGLSVTAPDAPPAAAIAGGK